MVRFPRRPHRKRFIISTTLCVLLCGLTAWVFWPSGRLASLRIAFSHFENVSGGRVAVFLISNVGDRAVTMYGYTKMWPNWIVAGLNGTNWDVTPSPGFDFGQCIPLTLRPGASASMPTFIPDSESWAVGVQYYTGPFARLIPRSLQRFGAAEKLLKKQMGVVWSQPITRASAASNVAPPLGLLTNQITVAKPTAR